MNEASEAGDDKKALRCLVDALGGFDKSVTEIKNEVAEIAKTNKTINAETLTENYDELKATVDGLTKNIANGNLFKSTAIAGGDSATKNFSILRLMHAVQSGDESKAKAEIDFCKAARKEMETRDGHSVSFPETGGYFVPNQVIPEMIGHLFAKSVLIDLAGDGETRVSVLDGLTGNKVTLPKTRGGVKSFWIGEGQAPEESNTKVGNISLHPKKLGALVKLTKELLKFSSPGLESIVRRDMVRSMATKLDQAALYGSGNDFQPRGIVNHPGIDLYRAEALKRGIITSTTAVADAKGGPFDYDAAIDMAGALEDKDIDIDDSFAFLWAPKVGRSLRKLKVDNYSAQTTNQPYIVGMPVMSDEELRNLLGHNFAKTTQIKTNKTAGQTADWGAVAPGDDAVHTDVFAGNWSEMLFALWGGIEIDNDDGKSNFANDEVLMLARMYCDFGVRHDEAFLYSPDVRA